jgi:hypothetical protein
MKETEQTEPPYISRILQRREAQVALPLRSTRDGDAPRERSRYPPEEQRLRGRGRGQSPRDCARPTRSAIVASRVEGSPLEGGVNASSAASRPARSGSASAGPRSSRAEWESPGRRDGESGRGRRGRPPGHARRGAARPRAPPATLRRPARRRLAGDTQRSPQLLVHRGAIAHGMLELGRVVARIRGESGRGRPGIGERGPARTIWPRGRGPARAFRERRAWPVRGRESPAPDRGR